MSDRNSLFISLQNCFLLLFALLCLLSPLEVAYADNHTNEDSAHQNTIVLGGISKRDLLGIWTNLIYSEAFRRLNIKFVFLELPLRRVSSLVDNEEIDGETNRAEDYAELHKNLVRVDESHFSLKIGAFTANPKYKFDSWDSLKKAGLRVECIRGVESAYQVLVKIIPAEKLSEIPSVPIALRKLIYGRTDVFVNVENVTKSYLHDGKFLSTRIYHAGTFSVRPMHMFLINKHELLAKKLEKVLREMKREGLVEEYRKEAAQRLRQSRQRYKLPKYIP